MNVKLTFFSIINNNMLILYKKYILMQLFNQITKNINYSTNNTLGSSEGLIIFPFLSSTLYTGIPS